MELMIKIPQSAYDAIMAAKDVEDDTYSLESVLIKAVENGIRIPKGHGDLIDASKIQFENSEFDTYGDYCRAFDAIDQADTIIEADAESEDQE